MALTKTYYFREEDYIDLLLFVLRKKIIFTVFAEIVIFSLISYFLDIKISILSLNKTPYIFIDYIITFILICAFVLSFRKLPVKIAAKKKYRSGQNDNLFFDFIISNNSIEKKCINEANHISWLDVDQVKETHKFYLFYITSKLFLFIPKSFLSEYEKATLRILINKNLDPKKNKLKIKKA